MKWNLPLFCNQNQDSKHDQDDLTVLGLDWIQQTHYELRSAGFNEMEDYDQANRPDSLPEPLYQTCREIILRYRDSSQIESHQVICDVMMLQRMLLHYLPPEILKYKAESLRRKFRMLVGQEVYDIYFGQSPANTQMTPSELRSDLDFMISETMEVYLLTPIRPQARARLLSYCMRPFFAITSIMIVLSSLLALIHQRYDQMATLAWIPVFGAMGAMISLQQRVENLPSRGDVIRNVIAIESGKDTLWTTSIAGAVFAVIMNLIFAARLIEGDLFPSFDFLVENTKLMEGETLVSDIAKMLIWAFIGGFAERLVPDTITRLTRVLQTIELEIPQKTSQNRTEEMEFSSARSSERSGSTLVALGKSRISENRPDDSQPVTSGQNNRKAD